MGILNNNILGSSSFTITENLDMNDFQINNLADPTSPQDAVTKEYADNLALDAGDVNSVFGRAGTVIAETGDYTASQITDIGTIIEPTELTDGDNPYYLIFASSATSTTPYINTDISIYPTTNPYLLIGNLQLSSQLGVQSNSGPLILAAQGGEAVQIDSTYFAIRAGNAIRLYDNDNSNYVILQPPGSALTSNLTLTLPSTAGSSGYILSTDGSGNLSWINASFSPSGSAGGDLDGTYPNPTVAKINGALLGDTTADDGRILVANTADLEWVSVQMHGDVGLNYLGEASIQPNVVTTDMLIGADADTQSLFVVNPTQTVNTGNYNTAFGYFALENNTTGIENTAFGYQALQNSNSNYGSAFGSKALASQTSGENDAFGEATLQNTTTGTYNAAFGSTSLYDNITGSYNTACGELALYSVLEDNNTAIGCYALQNLVIGSGNVGCGYSVGDSLITGSNNTFIGSNANGANGISNSCAIGSNAVVSISDAIVLGDGCSVGIGTSNPGYTLHVVGDMLVTDTINGTVTNIDVTSITADNIYYPVFTSDLTSLDINPNLIYTISSGIGTLSANALKISVNTGLQVKDPTSSFLLTFKPNSTLTNYRTLSFTTGDSDRNLTFTADATIGGTNSGDVTLAGQNYLSLSGQIITANQINLTSNVTGTLPVTNGGTGNASLTAFSVLLGNGTSAITPLTNGTTGQVLTANSGANPSWTTGVAPGGTASGDLSGSYPSPTVAKINGVTLGTTTATAGNLLIGSGSQWVTNVISGDITLGSTGITAIGTAKVTNTMLAGSIASSKLIGTDINTIGTITTGTWNSSVQISETYGGTNQTSYTLGDLLYSSVTNTLAKLAGNTTSTKKYLSQTGTGSASAAPTWSQIAVADLSNGTTGSGSIVLATSPTLVTPALGTPSALVGTNITGTAASLTAGNAANVAVTNTSALGRSNIAFINASSGNAAVNVDDLNLNYNASTATFRLGNNNNGTAAINLTTALGVNNTYGSGSTGVNNYIFAGAYNGGEIDLVSNGSASAFRGINANTVGIAITDKDFRFTTNASSGSTYSTAFTVNNANRTFIFGAGVRYPVTAVSGTYTALITDYYLAVDTSAARTITLPSASTVGVGFTLIIYDSTGAALTNNVTINRADSDTINGATSKALSLNYSAKIFVVTTSSTWYSAGWTGS